MTSSVLHPHDIPTGERWAPVELDGSWARDSYRSLLGGQPDMMPPGLVVPIARRAFSRGRALPPGGVLLGIDVAPVASLGSPLGLEYRATTSQRHDRHGRLLLTVAVELRAAGQDSVSTVCFMLRWPTEEHHD